MFPGVPNNSPKFSGDPHDFDFDFDSGSGLYLDPPSMPEGTCRFRWYLYVYERVGALSVMYVLYAHALLMCCYVRVRWYVFS